MGCGGSKDEQDEEVGKELAQDNAEDRNVKKLLLLGAGGSGKSTLFKQLQSLHGGGFATRDRKTFRSQIYEQIIEAMKIMITKCEDWTEEMESAQGGAGLEESEMPDDVKDLLSSNPNLFKLSDDVMDATDVVLNTRNNVELSDELCDALTTLWKNAAIMEAFKLRNIICVPDSTQHFMESFDRITQPDFVPNDQDLFLVRYRTTGMAEKQFEIDGTIFKICDVGGQRNERRKWIHFFDGVTAVIFVASLSAYDEVPFEDEEANSMIESLEIFEEHCNSTVFENTAFILFLNKKDLFSQKSRSIPITVCFGGNYKGNHYQGRVPADIDNQNVTPDMVEEEQYEFIKSEFEAQNKNPDERQIYIHKTEATDPDNINRVFNDVQHIVINFSLQRSGLL